MPAIKKTWQVFKNHFVYSYRRYHILKRATDSSHVYGASSNHAQETDAQIMTVDALQSLGNEVIEYKEEM